jgi:diguanylate cyclase (GGDEF)-like protein
MVAMGDVMNQAGAREPDEESDGTDRNFGPPIIGLMHRFADPDMERRFLAAMAPHSQRRLVSLAWVCLVVTLSRLAEPLIGVAPGVWTGPALWARIMPVLVCGATLLALRRKLRPAQLEAAAFVFAVLYLGFSCLSIWRMPADGSGAMIVGTVALLYFGTPVRITSLAPTMVAGSGCLLMVWATGHKAPSQLALFQVAEWLGVVNLLGIVAMRLMRFTLRRQWSLAFALRHLATHDGLTGIANRRHYDDMLAREWRRCRRDAVDISLILIDVDFFKLLNDGVGHEAGDDCLRELAAVLEHCVQRPGDLVARTGGEEFACVLPGTGAEEARRLAERIAAAVRAHRMPHPGSPLGPHITISLGVATARPAEGLSERDLAALADELVYAAKSGGRDCIRQKVMGLQSALFAAA